MSTTIKRSRTIGAMLAILLALLLAAGLLAVLGSERADAQPATTAGGTVAAAWGANGNGQLGDGTTTGRATPVQVSGLSGVQAVAGGGDHSLALKNDGTVWAWGRNLEGQLGDGTTTNRTAPVQVSGLSGVQDVAAGYSHSVALKSDGTARAWGYNRNGELGDGTTTGRATPVQVSGLTDAKAVASGAHHSVAVKSDGTARAWGWNYYGQLGDGTTTNRTTPVQVSGLSGVQAVEAGGGHSLAVVPDTVSPVTTATPSQQPNAAGWNNADVTISLSASDGKIGTGVKEIVYSATGAQQIASTTAQGGSASVPIATEGETTVTYYARDNAGNAETPKTLTVKLDKTAPTVAGVTPAEGATKVVRGSDVAATFSPGGAPMDPATLTTSTVELVKEGTTAAVPARVSCDDPCRTVTLNPDAEQLDENATYTATVKGGSGGARDAAGNELAEDKSWSFTTADTTAPTVSLTAPSDGAAVGGSSVTLSADAADNAGVEKVEFLVGGEVVGSDTTAENDRSYSVNWDSTTAADGPILVEAVAYDASAQTATSSRTVRVDNTLPTGSVLINNGAASTKRSSVRLALSATDPEPGTGVKEMRFSNNGANWSAWEPYVASKAWTLVRGTGTRTVYVEYRDGAGNVSSPPAKDTIRRRR